MKASGLILLHVQLLSAQYNLLKWFLRAAS